MVPGPAMNTPRTFSSTSSVMKPRGRPRERLAISVPVRMIRLDAASRPYLCTVSHKTHGGYDGTVRLTHGLLAGLAYHGLGGGSARQGPLRREQEDRRRRRLLLDFGQRVRAGAQAR